MRKPHNNKNLKAAILAIHNLRSIGKEVDELHLRDSSLNVLEIVQSYGKMAGFKSKKTNKRT